MSMSSSSESVFDKPFTTTPPPNDLQTLADVAAGLWQMDPRRAVPCRRRRRRALLSLLISQQHPRDGTMRTFLGPVRHLVKVGGAEA